MYLQHGSAGKSGAAKSDDLSSIPGFHMVEEENSCKLSSDMYIQIVTLRHTPTHPTNNKFNFKGRKIKIYTIRESMKRDGFSRQKMVLTLVFFETECHCVPQNGLELLG